MSFFDWLDHLLNQGAAASPANSGSAPGASAVDPAVGGQDLINDPSGLAYAARAVGMTPEQARQVMPSLNKDGSVVQPTGAPKTQPPKQDPWQRLQQDGAALAKMGAPPAMPAMPAPQAEVYRPNPAQSVLLKPVQAKPISVADTWQRIFGTPLLGAGWSNPNNSDQ